MVRYITIDGGTTNTRIYLWECSEVRVPIDVVKLPMGANAGREDAVAFRNAVRDGISALLCRHHRTESEITAILASGMITGEFGLYSVPHIVAPAGVRELHNSMKNVSLPSVSAIPFVLIPGVKTLCQTPETADMMRGEETELMGIAAREKSVYVFPGSHTKIIYTDTQHRITDFSTLLTGEMIAALARDTILKDAVNLSVSEADPGFLLKGFSYAKAEGMSKALFKVRVLKNIFSCTDGEIYGFFMGCLLCGEIDALQNSPAETVVIGGKAPIRKAIAAVLRQISDKKIVCLSDREADLSASLGMMRIYEYQGGEEEVC